MLRRARRALDRGIDPLGVVVEHLMAADLQGGAVSENGNQWGGIWVGWVIL